jgi:hypothetical protein
MTEPVQPALDQEEGFIWVCLHGIALSAHWRATKNPPFWRVGVAG